MSENAEHDWVERARQGEPTAIAQLYQRYWRAARAAAYGATGDPSLAEDAASEAFYLALDGLSGLRDSRRFGPWLRTIAVRTAMRLQTAASPKAPGFATAPQAQAQAPGARLEQQELAALVREAVRTLPPSLREAISLFYFEGYSVAEAARFLDVPAGTVKRRLHDGRRQLQSAAQQILRGSRPMDEQHERILQQLREAAEEGIDSEAFYQMMRKAAHFGPVPRRLLRDIMRRHYAGKVPKEGPVFTPEKEKMVREALRRFHEPSPRAQDPSHPVGAVANAIRRALPTFKPWQVDVSQIDLNATARKFYDDRAQALSYLIPPRFAEASSGAYITAERALLIEDQDGSVLTTAELIEKKDTHEEFARLMRKAGRLSDALGLLWKQPEPLELRAVEQMLRDLAAKVVPGVPASFLARQAPRYRAALRMQLGDSPIPAATGGVLNRWPAVPEGIHVASVTLSLEPWAAAHSGQTVELIEETVFPHPEPEQDDRDPP